MVRVNTESRTEPPIGANLLLTLDTSGKFLPFVVYVELSESGAAFVESHGLSNAETGHYMIQSSMQAKRS